jgi:hypothetical protein
MACGTRAWIAAALLAALAGAAPGRAQGPSGTLAEALEAYLDLREESRAGERLEALLAREDAGGAALLEALRACEAPLEQSFEDRVPYRDQLLVARITCPPGHARTGERLPVVLDVSGGNTRRALALGNVIVVEVPGYTPPEFSDEGRDGFLKVLRRAAHRAHGDPDRLWLTGFSWAAHASWDTALHRPGVLRGIVAAGGGPRRVHFRLLGNLGPLRVAAFCGKEDDRELIWNLEEVERRALKLELALTLTLDPERGHTIPLAGMEAVSETIAASAAPEPAARGTLLADGPRVESPWLRLDEVEAQAVAVPSRIPVSARASPDEQRRATLRAMEDAVARVAWKLERGAGSATLTLRPEAIERLTVLVREDLAAPGDDLRIQLKSKTVFDGQVAVDARTLLEEARRTGERLRPVLTAVELRP